MTNNSILTQVFLWISICSFSHSNLNAVQTSRQAENNQLIKNSDYSAFQSKDGDFKLVPTDFSIETEALNGVPHDYAISAAKYIEQAVLALDNVGDTPTRKYHRIKIAQTKGVWNRKIDYRNEFPYRLHFERSFDVPVEIVILPEPDIVYGILPEPIHSLTQKKKFSDQELDVTGFAATVFTLEKGGVQNLPSPTGYIANRNERNRDGYFITNNLTFRDLLEFPNSDRGTKQFGCLASRAINSNNSILRVCVSKGFEDVQTWIGYSMIDANGAVRDLTVEPMELPAKREELSFRHGMLRPLTAPSQVRARIEGVVKNSMLMAKDEDGNGVISQEWVMPSDGYADSTVPIWGLYATYESKPWRESFELAPVNIDKDLGELWKVFVFPNVRPDDLIESICKIKGINNLNPTQRAKAVKLVAPVFSQFEKAKSRYVTK